MAQRFLKNSTIKVAEALQIALMEHANLRKSVVCAEAVLMALIEQKDSIVLKIMDEQKMDTPRIRAEITDQVYKTINELPEFPNGYVGNLQMSKDIKNLFDACERERRKLGDAYISTGALFLACFDSGVPGVNRILARTALTYQGCLEALESIRGNVKILDRDAESKQSVLDEYTTDLTAAARRGQLDPVIGRNDEIDRVIQILSRRKKNNPILIGEPGVGKTVIVEGLANKIAAADVPEFLLNKRILSLEIGTLIAGAKMQGEFEERLKAIRDEVVSSAGEIILFIDEIHTVVGAGRSSGALDASNMLKPALARGQLQCIGATTFREFKQYIESDKALERRFQSVKVEQPSTDATFHILQGIKPRYEQHHKVTYTEDALRAAADLSDRYLPDRFLPDKAIDLMDEAGALKRLNLIYTPSNLRELEKKKKGLLDKKSQAFNEQDFESMAKYQMELSQIEITLATERDHLQQNEGPIDTNVSREDVAAIISKQTGIPVQNMVAEEAEKLLHLEDYLKRRVIGQEHAIKSVSNAIRRNRAGLRKANAPIASFMFLGPTGVGKTELAKALAAEVLDDEDRIIRIDMSEYMERHTVSKLIGSPPGYVGYGEGGQLTDQVRRQPYSVVLFDEFEKAHPDVFNLLLQVMDEGWLTDSQGIKVSFHNTIIIGTSNIGAEIMTERKAPIGIGAQLTEWSKDDHVKEVFKIVRTHFRPEFINRFDELIVFNKLGKTELTQIVDIQIADLAKRLKELSLTLTFTQKAKDFIVTNIDTLSYGARPLKRKIEQLVENQIASLLIGHHEGMKNNVTIEVVNNEISVALT